MVNVWWVLVDRLVLGVVVIQIIALDGVVMAEMIMD